jgi:hypothetical protein
VLSIRSTSVRLMTTLRLSDNSFSTPWRNVMVSHPATSRPTHRRTITSSQKCVLVLRATDVLFREKATQLPSKETTSWGSRGKVLGGEAFSRHMCGKQVPTCDWWKTVENESKTRSNWGFAGFHRVENKAQTLGLGGLSSVGNKSRRSIRCYARRAVTRKS